MFPHKLINYQDNKWKYANDNNFTLDCESDSLLGNTGYCAMWHSFLLHGTMPIADKTDSLRISLRLLLAKSKDNKKVTGIDVVNESIMGPRSLAVTNVYRNQQTGKEFFKKNAINEMKK